MQQCITKLIKPDQTGIIPGRQGTNSTRRTLNIMLCTRNKSQHTRVLSLDAQNAFDLVKWNFVFHTLTAFAVHSTFTDWVKTIYESPKSLSGSMVYVHIFCLNRGVRQGDCLDPLLFAMSIEPLAESIRQKNIYRGNKR